MMKRLLIASLVVLGGCSASPQVVNYTLTPIVQQSALQAVNSSAKPTSTSKGAIPYTLDRVVVPPQSDDLSLVVRDGADKLMVLTYDRWTVSLSDEVTQAIATALTDIIGMPPAQSWSGSVVKKTHNEVQVDVRRFEMLPGQSSLLVASWHIKFGTRQAKAPYELTCFSSFSHVATPGVLPLVQAQQKNIQQLSQKIAQTMQSRQSVAGVNCQ
jgi:uncharacterized lipoprotein YmbA